MPAVLMNRCPLPCLESSSPWSTALQVDVGAPTSAGRRHFRQRHGWPSWLHVRRRAEAVQHPSRGGQRRAVSWCRHMLHRGLRVQAKRLQVRGTEKLGSASCSPVQGRQGVRAVRRCVAHSSEHLSSMMSCMGSRRKGGQQAGCRSAADRLFTGKAGQRCSVAAREMKGAETKAA